MHLQEKYNLADAHSHQTHSSLMAAPEATISALKVRANQESQQDFEIMLEKRKKLFSVIYRVPHLKWDEGCKSCISIQHYKGILNMMFIRLFP